jgi:hypothetical protein
MVQQIPGIQSAINKMSIDIAVIQRDIDGLRRNMQDFRQFLRDSTGKAPPAAQ